jgi:DNA (cytosine-5)-methyltransferase 1
MKCLDLYSGIGGWTLGMKLAGVHHHSSYEWNPESNRTHNLNFGTHNAEVDIRKLEFSSLPKPGSIDIVVGSPPCTQFSFANRGGKGNLDDGLIDLHKFLKIVQHLQPKYWAMENVPRVSKIVNSLVEGHPDFRQFRKLITFNEVVNSWEYGTPQKRKRMICGNFPYERFLNYRELCPRYSMKDALDQLRHQARKDKLYGWPRGPITDNEFETPLNIEEARMNRESKLYHPVYNKMQFPDPQDKPARTVTSLCTRISRESIIIDTDGEFRRLTIRERGVLMGFPASYQFHGNSYSAKLKMIGNAIPPPLTYHLFNAMQGRAYTPLYTQQNYKQDAPIEKAPHTPPPIPKQMFKPNRNFRMCVAGYRYGSGVRFELSNARTQWRVRFFYGSSTSIIELPLNHELKQRVEKLVPKNVFLKLPVSLKTLTSRDIQAGWIGNKGVHPFRVIDELGVLGKKIENKLPADDPLVEAISTLLPGKINRSLIDSPKKTVAGLILGLLFNENITEENSNADRT